MFASHLIGVWLLTATWFNVGDSGTTRLSEPYEIRTYDTQEACEVAASALADALVTNKAFMARVLAQIPGSNAVGMKCTKQATEM